jgi:hypothetical protein
MMLHDSSPDIYRVAEHSKRYVNKASNTLYSRQIRCLSLLREYGKRTEVVNFLLDAANAAWSRGAHEVISSVCSSIVFLMFLEDCLRHVRQCAFSHGGPHLGERRHARNNYPLKAGGVRSYSLLAFIN